MQAKSCGVLSAVSMLIEDMVLDYGIVVVGPAREHRRSDLVAPP
jgi:hypothetical protein